MSAYSATHITNEQVDALLEPVKRSYAAAVRKRIARKICSVFIPVLFAFLLCLSTYFFFLQDDIANSKGETFAALETINEFCRPIMTLLGFGEKAWYISLLLCLGILMVAPPVLCAVIRLLVTLLSKTPTMTNLPAQPLPRLRQAKVLLNEKGLFTSSTEEKDFGKDTSFSLGFSCWIYAFFIAVLLLYGSYTSREMADNLILWIVIALVLGVAAYFVALVLCIIPMVICDTLCTPGDKATRKAMESIETAIVAEENLIEYEEEIARKAEERRQAAIKKEQEEKAAAQRRKMAEEAYEKATAGEEVDEELMAQAANLGHPEACLWMGVSLMNRLEEPVTNRERVDIAKQAQPYLKEAAPFHPIANLLYIHAQMLTEDIDVSLSALNESLNEVRRIKNIKDLPEKYIPLCNHMIDKLIEAINLITDPPEEEEEGEEKVETDDEKFNRALEYLNSGMCAVARSLFEELARKGDSLSMYNCALAYYRLGNRGQAIYWLRKAVIRGVNDSHTRALLEALENGETINII